MRVSVIQSDSCMNNIDVLFMQERGARRVSVPNR